jgi:hypothetical protein
MAKKAQEEMHTIHGQKGNANKDHIKRIQDGDWDTAADCMSSVNQGHS